MEDEVAMESASQISATGYIREQQPQLLHSEKKYHHIDAKAMLPMDAPSQ